MLRTHARCGAAIVRPRLGSAEGIMRTTIGHITVAWALLTAIVSPACREPMRRATDRAVYRLIEERQRAALGAASEVRMEEDAASDARTERERGPAKMYALTPHPLSDEMPEAFQRRIDDGMTEPPAEGDTDEALLETTPPPADNTDPESSGPAADTAELETFASTIDAANTDAPPFNLRDALAYAMRHGRRLQDAKEELYLQALDLTLERHLWTPRFVASITGDFEDAERNAEFDQTLTTLSEVAVTQRLPYGGAVTARVVHSLVRDVNERVTLGESGQAILEGNIPLLRGAGRSAYESRYAAERSVVYAARAYERFRRSFVVEVAAVYFSLQQLKTEIANTRTSYESRRADWEKAEFIERMGQSRDVFEAPRAKSILRQAEADLVRARQRYASALDTFKILIGMAVSQPLDVLDQENDRESRVLDDLLVDVDVDTAVDVALRYRLDLLTGADGLDDVRRGVAVAGNAVLPDLDLSGDVTANSNPEHRSGTTIASKRTSWRAGLSFRVDDRKAERNAYRAALIDQRRAQRAFDESEDQVRADVRRASRRIREQIDIRRIQALNVEENERRLAAARAQFDLGKRTNQDVVDAENELLAARNNFAGAVAAYRVAILEFRRDTGTLRVTDEGEWRTGPPPVEP
jgi:outer membrane protein TolC